MYTIEVPSNIRTTVIVGLRCCKKITVYTVGPLFQHLNNKMKLHKHYDWWCKITIKLFLKYTLSFMWSFGLYGPGYAYHLDPSTTTVHKIIACRVSGTLFISKHWVLCNWRLRFLAKPGGDAKPWKGGGTARL